MHLAACFSWAALVARSCESRRIFFVLPDGSSARHPAMAANQETAVAGLGSEYELRGKASASQDSDWGGLWTQRDHGESRQATSAHGPVVGMERGAVV